MATWRYVLLWIALLVGLTGVPFSLILVVTGAISVQQAVPQVLVSSAVVLTVSATLLHPRHKQLARSLTVLGILLSISALVLVYTP
jgi:hypothetical protein